MIDMKPQYKHQVLEIQWLLCSVTSAKAEEESSVKNRHRTDYTASNVAVSFRLYAYYQNTTQLVSFFTM